MSLKHMHPHPALALKQKGVVLLITLIVLVAMTLAAISLIRSVDTTNVIAGNLAFHSAATDASDIGIDDASVLLRSIFNTNQGALLNCTPGINCQAGYLPKHEPHLEPPTANTTWNTYWNNVGGNSIAANNAPAGYAVNYIIERLCQADSAVANQCFTAVPIENTGRIGCDADPNIPCPPTVLTYYRVTVRTAGPRNTVSFVQSILAM
ncbi:MAG: hypothetical protein HOO97_04810 [Sideroxydans sp.]|nr:hypothetical protein [Sideroxydans sp.]